MSFFVYKNLMNGKKDQYQKEKNYHHLNTKKTDQLSFPYTANPHILVLFTKFQHDSL